jgi:polyphosphate glucokinase
MGPKAVTKPKAGEGAHPITLAIDIGGTGVKALLLDRRGKPVGKRRRLKTPRPATPPRVIETIRCLVGRQRRFDRVAVGFPGWVEDGTVRTAFNLHPNWVGFDVRQKLEEVLQRPVRVINDAEVQGLGHISGQGLEVMITLGTGLGSAVFVDGKLVPGLEIGQQRALNGKTYDELLNRIALKKVGVRRWRKRVLKMVLEIEPVWNYRRLYLGGGNSRYLKAGRFPENVDVVSNQGGLWGGHVLWEHPEAVEWSRAPIDLREA